MQTSTPSPTAEPGSFLSALEALRSPANLVLVALTAILALIVLALAMTGFAHGGVGPRRGARGHLGELDGTAGPRPDGVAVFRLDVMRVRAAEKQRWRIKATVAAGPADDAGHLGLQHIEVKPPPRRLRLQIQRLQEKRPQRRIVHRL